MQTYKMYMTSPSLFILEQGISELSFLSLRHHSPDFHGSVPISICELLAASDPLLAA